MADVLQFRRGTQAENDAFTGAAGELSIDTTNWKLRIHDNSTAGGFTLARDSHTHAASDITEISNLTDAEGAQLENIDSVTITNTQWGRLGSLNQGVATTDSPTFAGLTYNTRTPEHATDGGTDAFASATNTSTPGDGNSIVRDFQSANTTTTPTLDAKTITDRDAGALWAGAINGVHELQYASGTDTYLLLDPRPTAANVNDAPVKRDSNGRAKGADPSAAQDFSTKAYTDAGDLTPDTEVDATNGGANDLTEIDFTGIKAGANRIEISLNNLSFSSGDDLLVQIGDSGGVEATGYTSASINLTDSGNTLESSTSGFIVRVGVGADTFSGIVVLVRVGGNKWVGSHAARRTTAVATTGSGDKELSAELDRVRITSNGSSTFDNGTVNILVE